MRTYKEIVKNYILIYTYTDENGNKRQKWETFETNAEAKKRKLQVEYEQESGTFIPPSAKTVNDLLDEYMSIYGVNTWALSTYESRKSLIANYIRPLIGDMKLEDVTPRIMDKYYRDLLSVKAVSSTVCKSPYRISDSAYYPRSSQDIAKCFQSSGQVGIDDQKPCGARYAAEGRTQDQGHLDSRSAPEGSGSLRR